MKLRDLLIAAGVYGAIVAGMIWVIWGAKG